MNASQAAAYGRDTAAGKQHDSQAKAHVVLRMDIADQGFAGFDALAASYENGSEPSLKDMHLQETAALTVRYTDIWGSVREVSVPFAVNGLETAASLIPNLSVAGYAQQGETIAIPMMLPDYASIINISVSNGNAKGGEKARIYNSGSTDPAAMAVMQKRAETSDKDEVRYTHVSIYENADGCEVALDGAELKFRFSGLPVSAAVATNIEGTRIAAASETYIYMTKVTERRTI